MLKCLCEKQDHINLNPYPLKLYGNASGTNQILAQKVAKLLKINLHLALIKYLKMANF